MMAWLLTFVVGVTLVWDHDGNSVWYHVYRSDDGVDMIRINSEPIPTTSYRDEGLDPLVVYRYAATAENAHSESSLSNQIEWLYTFRGDANLSGVVTVSDAVAISRHIVGVAMLEGLALLAADANGDGMVTVSDVTAIHRHIAGIAPIEGVVSMSRAVD